MSTRPSNSDVGTPLPDTPLPQIAGYRLLREIGDGGMSTVYLAEQSSLRREVAIKVMLPEALTDEVSRRRFENEARTIARLEHPHIVGIFEVGRTGDRLPYYTMPYLPRGHLGQRDFRNDHARIRAILRALLGALEFAHARGVVHRDVKAENVLFDEADRPLLADFGIALRRGFGTRVTTAGLAVGSTAYMAPEQARGGQVDQRADLYSVGVLAWEMLTGRLPFMAGDALSMAVKHAQDAVPRLPPELRHWQRFLDTALAKTPSQRFGNARQMIEALGRVPEHGGHGIDIAVARIRGALGTIRRWPRGAWIGLLLVGAMLGGIALRQLEHSQSNDFFRASGVDAGQADAADALNGALPSQDPIAGMLRAPPESDAEPWVVAATRQISRHRLVAPPGDNAYDSVVAAWQADPRHIRLKTLVESLIDAFAQAAERSMQGNDLAAVRDYIVHADRLASLTGQTGNAAIGRLRQRVAKALSVRMGLAETAFDRNTALQAVEAAKSLGLDAGAVAALAARAAAIPQAGDRIPGDPAGTVLVRGAGGLFAASRSKVSRDDYARFASATQRPASRCRERASLLRIVAPRSWQSPGFEQSQQQPVVCVSWNDAQAYAQWLGQRSGQRYRLPNAAEARALGASGGERALAEWLRECSEGCSERMSSGQSWRGASAARPLDPTRGYDDVGFRLVRDL